MTILYPKQKLGRFSLGMGFNFSYLHKRWGFDFGERFHKDPEYRVQTTMAVGREVHKVFGAIGLGSENPRPRPSVEPFGHRFLPALYGCECRFAPDSEPWAMHRVYSPAETAALIDFLCSDEAAFFAGQVLSPNGGQLI